MDIINTTDILDVLNTNDSITGDIETQGSTDFFKISLIAGQTVQIDLEGRPTRQGTLRDTLLKGIFDSEGNFIEGTENDDGGIRTNSQIIFTAETDGNYFIEAGAFEQGNNIGTYTLSSTLLNEDPDYYV